MKNLIFILLLFTCNIFSQNLPLRMTTLLSPSSTTVVDTTHNYYIDGTNGNNSYSGTNADSAWRDFTHINSGTVFYPKDTIFITGEIRQTLTVPVSGDANLGSIVFEGYGDSHIINGSDLISNWNNGGSGVYTKILTTQTFMVWFNDTVGSKVTDASLVNSTREWCWSNDTLYIYSDNDPSTRIIEAGQRNYCFFLDTKDNIILDGLEIKKGNVGLVYFTLSKNSIIKNCEIHDCPQIGIYGGITNGYIENNTIYNCWNKIDYPNGLGYGIFCQATTDSIVNTKIRYNNIHDNYRGISTTATKDLSIYYNLVVNSKVNGIDCQTTDPDHPSLVYNNTVIHNPSQTAGGHGIDGQTNGSRGLVIKNNLIYVPYDLSSPSNIQAISLQTTDVYSVDLDHNCYYLTPTSTAVLSRYDDTEYLTLTLWKEILKNLSTISGKDANSINTNPYFNNYNNGVYTLSDSSDCIDRGEDVGLTMDYNGNPIKGTPDIGAFENQNTNRYYPTNLVATAKADSIILTWTDPNYLNLEKVYIYNGTSENPTIALDSVNNAVQRYAHYMGTISYNTIEHYRIRGRLSNNSFTGYSNNVYDTVLIRLGTNLISDASSNFSTDGTSWWTIANGTKAYNPDMQAMVDTAITSATVSGFLRSSYLTDGKSYRLTFRALATSGTRTFFNPAYGNAWSNKINPNLTTSWQNYQGDLLNVSTSPNLHFYIYTNTGSVGDNFTIDDIVLKEILNP